MKNRTGLILLLYNYFKENEGKILTKDDICCYIWGSPYDFWRDEKKFHVTLYKLRKSLKNHETIKNYYKGYVYMNKNFKCVLEDCMHYQPMNLKEKVALNKIKKIMCELNE